MAGLNPDGLGRNRSFDDTESDSLKTEEVSGGVTDGTTLTRVAGGDEGDVVTLATFGSFNGSSESTANTTYGNRFSLLLFLTRVSDHLLNGDLVWKLDVRIDSGSGEQGSARLYNTIDEEPITGTEVTGATGDLVDETSGWAPYTPPTNGVTRVVIQTKTSDGANSTSFQTPAAYLGVRL